MVLKNNQIKLVKAGELRHVVSYLNEIIVKLQWTSETTVIQHKYTHIKKYSSIFFLLLLNSLWHIIFFKNNVFHNVTLMMKKPCLLQPYF